MKTEEFGGNKIKIRKLSREDLKKAEEFQDFINSLVGEKVKINANKKVSLKEEKEWVDSSLKKIKKHKLVCLVAESKNKIIANTSIGIKKGRVAHIGHFAISVRKDYRGIGLGKYLMKEVIELAQKELKPKPKLIRLSVFPNNKPAINLYEKLNFKKVAIIPKQFQYKGKLYDEIVMLLKLQK